MILLQYESKEHAESHQEFLEWYWKDDEELEQHEPNDLDDRHEYWLYMAWLAGRKSVKAVHKQELFGWMVEGSSSVLKGPYAELESKAEAKRIGGTCCAFPIYLKGKK